MANVNVMLQHPLYPTTRFVKGPRAMRRGRAADAAEDFTEGVRAAPSPWDPLPSSSQPLDRASEDLQAADGVRGDAIVGIAEDFGSIADASRRKSTLAALDLRSSRDEARRDC